ncbi:MAG: TonB-dependent receptor [Bacteroidota bacterium]
MIKRLLIASLLLLSALHVFSQSLRGKVTDSETDGPLADASVVLAGTGKIAATAADGTFSFTDLKAGAYNVVVTFPGYRPFETSVTVSAKDEAKLDIELQKNISTEIPTVSLDEAETETEGSTEVANLLHASRDVFQNISGFAWSTFRFRERGYDSGLTQIFMNGVPFNDPETGWQPYGEFSGLNDVTRNRYSSVGLDATEFAFGDLGGATNIDTRASVQRKQIRLSYSNTNRIYRNRVMLTYNTGLLPGGWALSVSGSHRWAQEGYVPGTFYDGYSYFVSADKVFNKKHSLNLTAFSAQGKRGRSADSFQEMYNIAGTNYYNPLWGYQNGKKRNSGVSSNNSPTAILRYDWTPSTKTHLTAAAYTQIGKNTYSRLNWQNAGNPYPDFNRNLPSSLPDTVLANDWTTLLSQNESQRQLNWDNLYEANRNNVSSTPNAEGIAGNTVNGKVAKYIMENQHSDNTEFGGNIIATHSITSRINLNGGINYQWYKGENYKTIDDLLGADYWRDWDFFGQFDPSSKTSGRQSDLRTPNHLVRKGDKFGYNYNENIRNTKGWAQAQFSLKKIQAFIAGELGQTKQWRTGLMQNGRFPNTSLGDSEKLTWNTYNVKAGLVYKINGRHYLYANGLYGTQAPQMRNIFLSPAVRNTVIPNATLSKVHSIEGGYLWRSPNYRARITGYFTEFLNETERIFASSSTVSRVLSGIDLSGTNFGDDDSFLQVPIFFGGTVMQGVNRRHTGVEIGLEAKPVPSWVFTGAASIGKYIYTSRPELYLAPDNIENLTIDAGKVYQKNFYVARTPQTAATIGVQYDSPKFWRAGLSLNYAGNMYYDFDRVRRTARFVDGVTPQDPIWRTIVDQQKAPAQYTLDFFASKSWRIRKKYFINLNVGINNLLDNQKILVSGRDSYLNAFRNEVKEPRFYNNELVYAPGLNYFVNIAFRM